MMMNLFSMFDPSSSLFSMSWMILIFSIPFVPLNSWKISYSFKSIYKMTILTFNKEVSFSLGKKEKSTKNMIMTVFLMILVLNFLALYPQIFSATSHLVITLPLSLLFWLSTMMFGWAKNTNHMLSHLVPQGTPSILMMFMVMIELVSNVIRPITLCVRLTANLIAGHLLMTLLGKALCSMNMLSSGIFLPVPLTLTILESAVACIQAYVFVTLITLYTTEIK